MKIWVLTGDKEETAINIGFACRLLTEDLDLHKVNDASESGVLSQLKSAELGLRNSSRHHALIIEGRAISIIEGHEGAQGILLSLCRNVDAVIACRVSPRQKSDIVKLVKEGVSPPPMCLAIGDGANDVPMISAAHVGIGISGNEGMQAVRASDYAIAQFRFLVPLLLFHGRSNYKRVALVILYSFYKNCALVMTLFWFCLFNGYSGASLFHSAVSASYNVIYTSLPIIVFGVFDVDVSRAAVLKYPELYKTGSDRSDFNKFKMSLWMTAGVLHSAILYFINAGAFDNGAIGSPDGDPETGLYVFGTTVANALAFVVNLRLALQTNEWTILHAVFYIGSAVSFWFLVLCISALPFLATYGLAANLFPLVVYWLSLPLAVVASLLGDYSLKFANSLFATFLDNATVLREHAKLCMLPMGHHDAEHELGADGTELLPQGTHPPNSPAMVARL